MYIPVLKIYRTPWCLLKADKPVETGRGECSLTDLSAAHRCKQRQTHNFVGILERVTGFSVAV